MDPTVRATLDRLYADDARQREAGLPTELRTRNLTPASGEFLSLLAFTMNARAILEIGSSNGVSTIWLAAAMKRTGGTVTGTEVIADRAAEANANLAGAGLAEFGQVLPGDAALTIKGLSGPFDLIFIDAEKEDYVDHFRRVFPMIRVGGLIVADNVLSHDISDYQTLVRDDPDCETTTVPLDRGLELTVRVR